MLYAVYVLQSSGFRLTLIGAVVFLVGLASLAVLPAVVAIVGMSVGGLAVFGGFIWTLLSFYLTPSQ
jgi:hypothetical protein